MDKKFHCSQTAYNVLKRGNILWDNETAEQMIERICFALKEIEYSYFQNKNSNTIQTFTDHIEKLLYEKKIVPSTPIMTNLGRLSEYPLSACIVPDIDLSDDRDRIKQKIDQLHKEGMGTWFNVTWLSNPLDIIYFLNKIGKELQDSWLQNRPVGNMGIMSIYDPHIIDFIHLKYHGLQQWIDRKFNFSVDIDQAFLEKRKNDDTLTLWDGSRISARYLLHEIARYTYLCGDPGIICLDSMNKTNSIAHIAPYKATAPCGEVWLAPWETCQFSSLNLAQYIDNNGSIEYDQLQDSIYTIVRFLDDCLEYSIHRYTDYTTTYMSSLKRKIGVGVCGFGDMLIKMWLIYWSQESIQLAKDIMSFITYHSKMASIALAQERWSFPAIKESTLGEKWYHYTHQYAHHTSQSITHTQREELDILIGRRWIRNASTTALPPTGRSSIVFDTSQQIEPIFNLTDYDGHIRSDIIKCLWWDHEKRILINTSWSCKNLPPPLCDIYQTSIEIDPQKHLDVLLAFQAYTDEAVSKTINLPHDCTIQDIENMYIHALQSGIKWITFYRDGSRTNQPVALSA